jgi:N-dimethylarginine dimethylaminohydrolase
MLAGKLCVMHRPSFLDLDAADAIAHVWDEHLIDLNDDEKAAFAGNCIAVTPRDVLFSATSLRALSRNALAKLEAVGLRTHDVEIDELEKGGGSLRCLIAEVY